MNGESGHNELVRKVVEEVLRRLRSERETVRVLGKRSEALASDLEPYLEPGATLLFQGEGGSGQVSRRILPVLTCADMADLASGRASSPEAAEALALLLAGQEVEVLEFAYRAHRHSAPEALYALYSLYEERLASFGLVAVRPRARESFEPQGGLLTARDVDEAVKNGASVITIRAGTLVTPLAADAARDARVTLVKGRVPGTDRTVEQ
jgi:hypothetical protein